ncbi:MAG: MotA/TolQ/ExbB proton channel family protein [Cellvibrionales bacterium]|jgi:biopolymer transport protein ExbB/TolQ|nr:MotA/TolQ/ExbB proton channel family protein [Cellvibrionales bacterium]MCH9797912.1 MotA/TolQ/ExbB proton channel family protein [Gammaproteobacteria bacterium]MCH9842979.1 MotA/TolQ/ExbB proton channel family protein [Gammaproteobacteria bacterium]MDA7736729.1 MotA/TolQ/ExbB proton channel family protein [Porticoccus sp.]MDC0888056.1 MotA/TolQ/ExbB proton channel family protein [Porticoccus sp.]
MQTKVSSEFMYQIFSLILALIVVHTVYLTLIRPNANNLLENQLAKEEAGEPYVAVRSFYIVIKDFEQEACFILMIWACAIMGYKARCLIDERKLLNHQLLTIPEGTRILPKDARQISRPIQALSSAQKKGLIPRVLLIALHRFDSTKNIQDVSNAISEVLDKESDKLDSELSMVRYIAWAIPSIGFIGTVRGIGEALSQAHKAVQGDIAGVTASLGVAFNSTFIALVISIFLMFIVHQLQLAQERLVLDSHDYCDNSLIRHLKTD